MSRPLAAAVLVTLLATGCAAARVRVDPALAGAAPLEVTGANPRRWGAPLRFGPHSTGAVSGDTTFGWSLTVLADAGAGVAGKSRPYAWTSAGPGGAVAAECHDRELELFAGSVAFDVKGATGQPRLACAFRPAGGAPWTLAIRATGSHDPAYRGELRGGAARYAVRSVHALEGSPLPLGAPAGWALERDGHVVAMVETVNAGRVWLPAGAGDEGPLAAAATALLLFNPE